MGHKIDYVINQVRNRLGMKGRRTNHLWSQVVSELVLITCLKRNEGMTGRRNGGTKGRRDEGTTGRSNEGTKGRRDEGTTGRRDEGMKGQRDE